MSDLTWVPTSDLPISAVVKRSNTRRSHVHTTFRDLQGGYEAPRRNIAEPRRGAHMSDAVNGMRGVHRKKCLDKHHRGYAMHRERINTTHLRPLLLRCLFPQISRVLRFTAHGPNSPGLRKSSERAQIQAHAAEELEARARPSRQILPEEEAASA